MRFEYTADARAGLRVQIPSDCPNSEGYFFQAFVAVCTDVASRKSERTVSADPWTRQAKNIFPFPEVVA